MQHGGLSYGRGVWVAPWQGPNGELLLVALDRNERQVGDLGVIPIGGNHLAVSDALWARLEKHDPMPQLRVI